MVYRIQLHEIQLTLRTWSDFAMLSTTYNTHMQALKAAKKFVSGNNGAYQIDGCSTHLVISTMNILSCWLCRKRPTVRMPTVLGRLYLVEIPDFLKVGVVAPQAKLKWRIAIANNVGLKMDKEMFDRYLKAVYYNSVEEATSAARLFVFTCLSYNLSCIVKEERVGVARKWVFEEMAKGGKKFLARIEVVRTMIDYWA